MKFVEWLDVAAVNAELKRKLAEVEQFNKNWESLWNLANDSVDQLAQERVNLLAKVIEQRKLLKAGQVLISEALEEIAQLRQERGRARMKLHNTHQTLHAERRLLADFVQAWAADFVALRDAEEQRDTHNIENMELRAKLELRESEK